MNGLDRYIEKNGKHFTVELAYAVVPIRWKANDIYRTTQKEVYYNVTGSTLGDMVYLANEFHNRYRDSKWKCIASTLCVVGDYDFYERVFNDWLESLSEFDFTPYI